MKIVDDSTDQLFRGMPGSPLQLLDQQKHWEGTTMHFSFTGKMGFFTAPLRGTVLVTDKDVTVEVDLPPLLKSFIPEQKIEESIKSRVRGLLT
jgi:Putative polyhydroxyalkanoic acid system protein (PHA_gran_rgn)